MSVAAVCKTQFSRQWLYQKPTDLKIDSTLIYTFCCKPFALIFAYVLMNLGMCGIR